MMNQPYTIKLAANNATASPDHKRFQSLLVKIDKARNRLASWQNNLVLYGQAHQQQVVPLLQKLDLERHQLALQLERLQLSHKWSKADRASLSDLVCAICAAMLDGKDEPDPEVKALYNRHAALDFDSAEQQQMEEMKSMVESATGLDLGEEAADSLEELMQRARARLSQEQESEAQSRSQGPAPGRRQKPPRQTAAQKRAEEDQQRISQTVREVYRKLASALHPDRLPAELPAPERERLTELMQRTNSAYERGDLLALLELQLQIEQVDLAHANRMAAEQVRHFNKVLTEQLREVQAEIEERQHAFCATYSVVAHRSLNPDTLGEILADDVKQLLAAQHELAQDRRLLGGEQAQVKAFLKRWRAQQLREPDWDFGF